MTLVERKRRTIRLRGDGTRGAQEAKEQGKLFRGVTTKVWGKQSRPGLFWRRRQCLQMLFFQTTLAGVAKSPLQGYNLEFCIGIWGRTPHPALFCWVCTHCVCLRNLTGRTGSSSVDFQESWPPTNPTLPSPPLPTHAVNSG